MLKRKNKTNMDRAAKKEKKKRVDASERKKKKGRQAHECWVCLFVGCCLCVVVYTALSPVDPTNLSAALSFFNCADPPLSIHAARASLPR